MFPNSRHVCEGRGNHKLQRLSSAGFIAHEATPVETIQATRAPFWLVGPFSQIQSPVARNVESRLRMIVIQVKQAHGGALPAYLRTDHQAVTPY